MTNCKYKLRKLSVGLVSVGTMLIAPTVLGQEVNASTETSTTSTSTASVDATTSGTAATTPSAGTSTSTGEAAGSGASSEANGASSVVSSEESQSSGTTPASPQAQTAPAATSTSSASSSNEKTPKTATTTTSTSSTPVASTSNNSNKVTSTEAETPMMDVEQYTVDKKDSSVTQTDDKKLLKIRRDGDEKTRDLYDVKREVKDNGDGTLDVTLKVTPKQIDEGADVMALLDVSKKMTETDFKNAKEKIKKLVTTLTSKSTDNQPNHNARNSVRLMTFYRKVNDPIELNEDNVDAKLDEVWKKAKEDWNWGVDLQGAIHKARDIFKKEKNSKKRQHIVLFSQGESTFSYDINDKTKLKAITEDRITTSNPLLPWLPIFNHTNRKAEVTGDLEKVLDMAEKLGITVPSELKTAVKAVGLTNSTLSSLLGKGLTQYLALKEYSSDDLDGRGFDYSKRVGEGYYYYSFSDRKSENKMPLESAIRQALTSNFPKLPDNWFFDILKSFDIKGKVEKAQLDVIMQILNSIFYIREYHYYNHNLSAIAEAKMAQKEGIAFYSVDVTSPNHAANKRTRRSAYTPEEKRNEKFDKYLKDMSEGRTFLEDKDVTNKDKFKDTLTELKIKDEFTENVTVQESSKHKTSLTNGAPSVSYTAANNSFWSNTKESLTWTISKDQLKKAFESGKPLTLTYKLKVEKEKFKKALQKQQEQKNRKKRAASTESENTVTETIISNKISYKINNGTDISSNKLEDVKMSYSKFKMPIPELDIEVVVPKVPEKPLVEPMTPLYPAIPNYPTPQLPKDEDLEISGGHGPIVDIVEDTGTGVEGGAQNGVVSTQENKDPIVDITEDTQPGMSGSNDAKVVEEDTAPKRPDILVGGQSDPIDITEDTQPGMSGSNDATVVEEDTAPKRPDILVGGQSDPIDITEDTQPGMSGSNDATVIEEDTKPKRFFHFDNEPQAPEKPKEQPSLSLPQAPVYKAAHHLPASGDKREASFTIAALTIIGAAGLLSKKRRDTEEN
ncbi:fibronectin binding protein [Streptococcus pyogenes]|uniref:serum opacification factor n=1 Tax=Streptococcus pyogenes TaxID=1314 RepID=UPI001E450184|nr:serum opacification factor [Streptococcus pyogenes]UEN86890.1 fibronectin binding protein [Streptococcus pyogenes]